MTRELDVVYWWIRSIRGQGRFGRHIDDDWRSDLQLDTHGVCVCCTTSGVGSNGRRTVKRIVDVVVVVLGRKCINRQDRWNWFDGAVGLSLSVSVMGV